MTPPALDRALLQEVANHYRLPVHLLAAQVMQESSGDPFALRFEPNFFRRYIRNNPQAAGYRYGPLAACSFGLLQIMLEVACEMGFEGRPETLFDARIGLEWGARHMSHLWSVAGRADSDYRSALAAYNGGQSLIAKPDTSWPSVVKGYVDAVYAKA